MGSFLSRLFRLKPKYGVPSQTLQGEKVRSKGEKIIANYLFNNGIAYQYEKAAKTWALGKRIARPDFYLVDYKVYVEYWGMVDVKSKRTSSKYVRMMKWKMAMYYKHKIKFISIYPSNLDNLDWIFRAKFKEVMGFELVPVGLKR